MAARVALVVLALALSSLAMYEDEAGKNDWHRKNIGQVRFASIMGKHTLVSSAYAIAALYTKSGGLAWRQVAPREELFENTFFAKKYVATSLVKPNGDNTTWRLAAWATATGAPLWDVPIATRALQLASSDADEDDESAGSSDSGVIYLALADGTLAAHSSRTGALVWKKEAVAPRSCRLSVGLGGVAHVAHLARGGAISVHSYSPKDGADHGSSTLIEVCNVRTGVALVGDKAICLNPSGNGIQVLSSENAAQVFLEGSPLSEILPVQLSRINAFLARADNALAVVTPDGKDVFRAAAPAGTADAVAVAATESGEIVVAHLVVSESGSRLEVTDSKGTLVSKSSHTVSLAENGRPMRLWALARKGRVYTLALMEDMSLYATGADGAVAWKSEEALSDVEALEFVDLPPPDVSHLQSLRSEFAGAQGFMGLVAAIPRRMIVEAPDAYERLLANAISLSTRARVLLSGDKNTVAEPVDVTQASGADAPLTKDKFGFDQVVVAATRAGVVYGILTGRRGEIWWRSRVGESAAHQATHAVRAGSEIAAPEVALVRIIASQQAASTEVLFLDAHTGRIISREKFAFPAAQSFTVPSGEGKSLVIVERTQDGAVVLHATRGENIAKTITAAPGGKISVFLADATEVAGYVTMGDGTGATRLAWRKAAEGETVMAVASHHRREVVHSPGRIMGNRTIRAKFLDRNAFAFATQNTQEGTMTVSIVDGVTGSIIGRAVHRKSAAPVRMIMTENSVIYHFWAGTQFRVGVMDVYETRNDWSSRIMSSYATPEVQVYQQTYVMPAALADFAPTTSIHGAASKQLIFALEGGEVFALDKKLVDARRAPANQVTAEDKEEGVVPYASRLPLDNKNALTYNHIVARMRLLDTAPTYLESTSHVLAVGLDLFYTRTAPSGSFDILNSDFNYELLIATVLVLVVLHYSLQWMLRRKALKSTFK